MLASFIFIQFFLLISAADQTPLVIWHGMGDSCCNPLSMGSIMRMIRRQIPDIYIHSLEIGNGIVSDTLNGFFMPIPEQITLACNKIKSDPQLSNGFNAMGFSQGGQFLRAVVQQCEGIQVKNLISFGGQHQGVFGFPNCPSTVSFCDSLRDILNKAAYNPLVQARLVQAEYWHDAIDDVAYKTKNIFLPDLNNEVTINEDYKNRLKSLNKFVMVRFNNDTMVQPLSSEFFGFYAEGQDTIEVALEDTELYKQFAEFTFMEDWCWYNGELYDFGEEWNTNDCTTCSCVNATYGVICENKRDNCPVSYCDSENEELMFVEGACCPICINKAPPVEFCSPIHVKQTFNVSGCIGSDIDFSVCDGFCPSQLKTLNEAPYIESQCRCCKPSLVNHKKVDLECPDGSTTSIQVPDAKSCQCIACDGT